MTERSEETSRPGTERTEKIGEHSTAWSPAAERGEGIGRHGTRRGLVLGAGGVLGFAWAVGALAALESEEGFDARQVDMLIGTSAGSITAALLGCGVPVEAMVRQQRGIPAPGDPVFAADGDAETGPLPPRPALGMGSPSLLARSVRHPLQVTPLAALSSVAPRGQGSLESVGRLVAELLGDARWAPHPSLWVVAMDYASGRRVAFGREGEPDAALPEAVTASCAIPGWFAPVEIGGRRYVDGGACSSTSVDLLAGRGLDEVYVVAPMASFVYDAPSGLVGRFERRIRRSVTRRLVRELRKVRCAGVRVTVLAPGPADLEAIGANLMDASRRDTVLDTSLRTSVEALRRGGGTVESYPHDDGDTAVSRHADPDREPRAGRWVDRDGDTAAGRRAGRPERGHDADLPPRDPERAPRPAQGR